VSESPIGGRSALLVQQIETAERIGPRGGVMKYARLLPAACDLRNPKQERQEAQSQALPRQLFYVRSSCRAGFIRFARAKAPAMNNKDEITATRMNLDAHGGRVARTLAVSAAVLFTILLVLQAQSP
jgi:hypothetical protein